MKEDKLDKILNSPNRPELLTWLFGSFILLFMTEISFRIGSNTITITSNIYMIITTILISTLIVLLYYYNKIKKNNKILLTNIIIGLILSLHLCKSITTFSFQSVAMLILNYLIILCMTSPIFFVKRKKTYSFFIFLGFMIFSIISYSVIKFRGEPLTYYDFYSIEDGLSIVNTYFSMTTVILFVSLIAVCLFVFIKLFKSEKQAKRNINKFKIVIFLCTIIVLPMQFNYVSKTGKINPVVSDLTYAFKFNGITFSTLKSVYNSIRVKPQGYSKKEVASIKDELKAASTSDKRKLSSSKPNIILIQLESFMDPNEFKNIEFSENPIPNFTELCKTNTSGMANVPTFGAGTVRTEFEVITGLNTDYLGPGEIPYNTFLKNMAVSSLATNKGTDDYKKWVMHNHQGNFYNRNSTYKNMGFDNYISKEYMSNYETNQLGWMKDEILTKYIKDCLSQTKQSDLIFTISVQPHGKYPLDAAKYDLPISVSGDIDESDKSKLYYYVNQLKETDTFVGQIKDMVDKSEEDTIVLFYSDHLPKMEALDKYGNSIDKYKAPFLIYSNFETEKRSIKNIEAYQLSTLLYDLAGVEFNDMQTFHYYKANDKDYVEKYKLLQYDMLFGENHYAFAKEVNSNFKMGLKDVELTEIDNSGKDLFIKGNNFTEKSVAFVNDREIKTKFIDATTLRIDFTDDIKSIVVKQIGRHDAVLGKSNILNLK
ncbi:MAG: sulfatase-like hydrolase/transferase [Terrisporobacter sp.]|uniref:LTA synthase family protein n=1 Tax=Terrisporobacter sp. TaxID=1965305 RepID=UPI002FC65B34